MLAKCWPKYMCNLRNSKQVYVKHEIYLLRLNLLWDPCENAPAFFLIVCTLHVLCADDVLMLTFTECWCALLAGGDLVTLHRLDLRPSLAWHKGLCPWAGVCSVQLLCIAMQFKKGGGESSRYSWSVPSQVSNCIHNLPY